MGVHALCLERRLIKQGRTDGIKVWYMVFLYYWCDICRIKKETAVHLRQCPRSIYVAHVVHVAHTSDRDIASSEKTMFQNNIHTALPESPTAILIFSKVGRKLVCWAAPRVRKAKSLIRTPHHRHRHGGTQVRVASCMSPRVQEFPCMQFEYVR